MLLIATNFQFLLRRLYITPTLQKAQTEPHKYSKKTAYFIKIAHDTERITLTLYMTT
jgi:hypothetical protein